MVTPAGKPPALCRSHPVAHIAACRYVMSARHWARKCTSLGNGQAMSMAKVGQHRRSAPREALRPAQEGEPVAVGHRGHEEGYSRAHLVLGWPESSPKNSVSATLQRDCSLAKMHKNNRIRVEPRARAALSQINSSRRAGAANSSTAAGSRRLVGFVPSLGVQIQIPHRL